MRIPSLAVASFVLLASWAAPAAAQDRGARLAAAASAAREDLKKLASAVEPLRRDYAPRDRRPVQEILEDLRAKLAVLEPEPREAGTPRAQAWRKLSDSAAETAGQEKLFWSGVPNPDAPIRLPAATAEPLTRAAKDLDSGFSALFPEPGRPGDPRLASGGTRAPPANADTGRLNAAVGRSATRGAAASANPELFFDGGIRSGDVGGVPAGGAGAGSSHAGGRRYRVVLPDGRTVDPSAGAPRARGLDTAAVPIGAAAPVKPAAPGRASRVARAVRTAAPGALRDAVRATPVVAPAARALKPRPPAPPAAAPAPAAPSAATACREALKEHPTFAGMCENSPTIAPLLAGLVEALKEQFGTVQGLLMNVAFLLLGLVLSALSGFGLIAKIAVSLVSFGMLIGTIYPLLKQGAGAVWDLLHTKSEDAAHARSLVSIGKVGGAVLIMALMAAIGWGVGKTSAGKRLTTGATDAISSKLTQLGLKDTMAALDAKIPASVRSFFGGAPKAAPEAKPAENRANAPETVTRSAKSRQQFSDETVLRNSRIPSREARIETAMKDLKVERGFAEKIADAHDQVPCPVGGCSPAQLRRKLEIMGRGPEAEAAIRSGLAGDPPKPGAALEGAPKEAAFMASGEVPPFVQGSAKTPAAAPAAHAVEVKPISLEKLESHVFRAELTESGAVNSLYQPRRISGGGHTQGALDAGIGDIRASVSEVRARHAADQKLAASASSEAPRAAKRLRREEPPPAEGTHWTEAAQPYRTVKQYPNGVKLVELPEAAFKSKAWKQMEQRAKMDPTYKPGGKSLFPEKWSKSDILSAAEEIRQRPSRTMAEPDGRKTLFGEVERHGQRVKIEVAIDQKGGLMTTYPSWEQ